MQTNPQIALAWLALVAWTALIAGLSGGDFSHHETSRFLVPFLRWVWPGISSASLELAQVAVRKGAHLAEYAVLAGLAVRAVWVSCSLP